VARGRLVEDEMHTFAEGLQTRVAFELPQRIIGEHLDDFVLVSDDEIRAATLKMIELTRNLVEPAGAAPLAAALRLGAHLKGKRVALLATGGNITPPSSRSFSAGTIPAITGGGLTEHGPMRAMRFEAVGRPLTPSEVPVPDPDPGQLLIKVHACGICRTDLHLLDGEVAIARPPRTLGHQIVARSWRVNAPHPRRRAMVGLRRRDLQVLHERAREPL